MKIELGLSVPLVRTRDFERGLLVAQAGIARNRIVAIDGIPGVGKTTCVRQVTNDLSRPVALVTLPANPKPNDLLRYTYQALGGGSTDGLSHFDLQGAVADILTDSDWVVIVDEMQQAAAAAMAELVWLYEHTFHGFGVVVAGSGVLTAVQRHPQLATRIMGSVHFLPLRDAELLHAVKEMDPRLAATESSLLLAHDEALCLGRLRPWVLTVEWLEALGIAEGPVPTEVLSNIKQLMVESEVAA